MDYIYIYNFQILLPEKYWYQPFQPTMKLVIESIFVILLYSLILLLISPNVNRGFSMGYFGIISNYLYNFELLLL